MNTNERDTPEFDEKGRELYQVGDIVTIPFQRYPGPVSAPVQGKVIKRLSPTYYEFEYTDDRGRTRTKRLIRSHLP